MFLIHYSNRSAPGYSLALALAIAGREIALLSYPKGDPGRKLKMSLNLIKPACKLPFRGSRGSGLGVNFMIISDLKAELGI